MRKILFFALALCLCYSVSFVNSASAAELKIGIFSIQEVATKSDAYKENDKKLQDTFSKEKNEIEKEQNELKTMAEALGKPEPKLTPEQLEEKQLEYVRKKRALDEKTGIFLRRVEQTERRMQQDIANVIVVAAQEYGKRNDFSLIMDATSAGVLHAVPSLDITDKILAETNKIWKENPPKPGAALPPTGAAAPAGGTK